MSLLDYRDAAYRETYDSVMAQLEGRRQVDPSFGVEDAKGTLKHLYVQEGNDWLGRGELQDLKLEAQIDAYESFIAKWEAEGGKEGPA